MKNRELSGAAQTAKVIKRKLSALYPNVKFSVKSDIFSMGDSVDIKWTDGPLEETVKAITDQYQCGDFDGMNDLYTYRKIDALLGCPGAKYVQCERHLSPECSAKVMAKAKEYYAGLDDDELHRPWRLAEIEKLFFPSPEAAAKPLEPGCQGNTIISGLEYEIIKDKDTRNGNEIFVVKVETRVNNFNALRREMDAFGGYYSRFKRGFIFNYDPRVKLVGETEAVTADNEAAESVSITEDKAVTASVPDTENVRPQGNSLLNKFASVEINTRDNFPAEDMAFCEDAENIYKLAHALHIEIYEKALAFAGDHETQANLIKKYIPKFSGGSGGAGLEHYLDSIINDNVTFINEICYHFAQKYNVTIDAPSWIRQVRKDYKLTDEDRLDIVPLEYVLDCVHEQMGGMSFSEMALSEVKKKMKGCFYNTDNKTWHLSIKGSKLVFDKFYISGKNRAYSQFELTVELKHLAFFEALTHCEYGKTYLHHEYGRFTERYTILERTGIYAKHMISSAVISSVKVSKSGAVEIEFKDSAAARRFAMDYCEYTERIAG